MLTENTDRMTIPPPNRQTAIAVVIPVFNCKKYLTEAVESVLRQPYQKISIVLVDDGSTDGSGQLCDDLASQDDRIVVIHQENAGVSVARNAGIEYIASSYGKDCYIAFLDADDGWTENFFDENIIELLTEKYDLIGFQYCNCDSRLRPTESPANMESGLHTGGQSSVWIHAKQAFFAMFYSCKFLMENDIRFFEELKYSEDKIFSMQCMYLADSIYLVNKLLYLYRHAGNSAMSRRQHGIPYFVPIIDGYLKLDSMMRQKKDDRMPLTEGRLMASIYIMDMIDEHYNMLRSKKELDALFADRPHYISILEASGEYSDLRPNATYIQYKNSPRRYIIQNNLNGGIKACGKIIRKLHYLAK